MPPTDPTPSVTADQLTRALGEAVIRIWSNLPQDVQLHLFQEMVTSHGESIRAQLAVFLHDKHPRTSDPLGNPREMMEPDSLGVQRDCPPREARDMQCAQSRASVVTGEPPAHAVNAGTNTSGAGGVYPIEA